METNFSKVFYGGDYNPDQWPESVWQEDMRLFNLAGINMITVPVFSWVKLQPDEHTYTFDWLDKIMALAQENGLSVCLATSTAAQPAWMSRKYPEVLPVDFDGRKRKHGGRVNFCPNSHVFRFFSGELAGRIAARYHDHPALQIWHIGNEYGNYCYCETCEKAFRVWLKKRYRDLDTLNRMWNMSFWGHTITHWDEIEAPSGLNEMWRDGDRERTIIQGMAIDYKRFMSDSSLACFLNEKEAIRKHSSIPVTTNFMWLFKPLDYFKWAKELDIVSWDNYPDLSTPASAVALNHDLMRGLKGGKPFLLMEQTPSQTNWQPFNSLKRPGMMRLYSYQAMAHGSDSVMFFQLRRSIGGCEKFHGAIIEHVGHEHTRVFSECTALGAELTKLSDIVGAKIAAKVAIVFDWDNWWAVELSSGPSIQLKYTEQVIQYHKAFFDHNIPVDIVGVDADLSGYAIVVAPVLYMVKPGMAARLEQFVADGGTFVTTFFSGIVGESDLVAQGGYPGELRKLLGIWVEEIDSLMPDQKNLMRITNERGHLSGNYACGMLCDLLDLEGAEALAAYGDDFYAGKPVLTVNRFGKGNAWYIASNPDERFLSDLALTLCEEAGVHAAFVVAKGVEITQRVKENNVYTFILNHNAEKMCIDLNGVAGKDMLTGELLSGDIELAPKGVVILESKC